jgi:hypothetical protein
VAIFVLALLALDLGDAWCDPLILPMAGSAITTPPAGPAEACAGICVPDCFCCSTIVPAVHVILVWQFAPSIDVPLLRTAQASTGFVHPLDHVPIATQ